MANEAADSACFIICSQSVVKQEDLKIELGRFIDTFQSPNDSFRLWVAGRQVGGPIVSEKDQILKKLNGFSAVKYNDCVIYDAISRAIKQYKKLNDNAPNLLITIAANYFHFDREKSILAPKKPNFYLIVLTNMKDQGSIEKLADITSSLQDLQSENWEFISIVFGNVEDPLFQATAFPRMKPFINYQPGQFRKEISDSLGDAKHLQDVQQEAAPKMKRVANMAPNTGTVPREAEKHGETEQVVLLLGETGCGKSTLINAMTNYLRYKSFDEAGQKRDSLTWPVPACFHLLSNDLTRKEVLRMGDLGKCRDDNMTQEPATYKIVSGEGMTYSFVDTPGMGDYRGFEYDQENFDKILDYLRRFKQIRAILFLMHTNETRLTDFFQYCVNKTMSYLETISKANGQNKCDILFGLTHCVGSDYSPGSSLAFIQREAKNHGIKVSTRNVFCFDNESFRNLAIMQSKIRQVDDETLTSCRMSWEKSAQETMRLLKSL